MISKKKLYEPTLNIHQQRCLVNLLTQTKPCVLLPSRLAIMRRESVMTIVVQALFPPPWSHTVIAFVQSYKSRPQ